MAVPEAAQACLASTGYTHYPLPSTSMALSEASSSSDDDSSDFSSSDDEDAPSVASQAQPSHPRLLPPAGQTHCPLFCLPPELRNKIYGYLLDPSPDGTCCAVHSVPAPDHVNNVDRILRGIRCDCVLCLKGELHNSCVPEIDSFVSVSGPQRHPAILGTCRRIFDEAKSFLRTNSLHVTAHDVPYELYASTDPAASLKHFLAEALPRDHCIPVLTLRLYPSHDDEDEFFGRMDDEAHIVAALNDSHVRFNHLEVITTFTESEPHLDYTYEAEREIVLLMDGMCHKPARVTWRHNNESPLWDEDTAACCKLYFEAVNQYFEDSIRAGQHDFADCPIFRDLFP